MNKPKPIIAILGAGKLGMVLAQLTLKAGYLVYVSGSGAAEKIALSVEIIAPGAVPATTADAIAVADIIILALPLGMYWSLPVTGLNGKVVVDAMNYWWEVDGEMPELPAASSSSEMVQAYLTGARIVKGLSHMGYHDLLDYARPAGQSDRMAIALCSDDTAAAMIAAWFVNDLGFDPVKLGPLHAGLVLEPGRALFGATMDASAMRSIVARVS